MIKIPLPERQEEPEAPAFVCGFCGATWEGRDVGHAAARHDLQTDDHAFSDEQDRVVGEDPGYGPHGIAHIAAAEALLTMLLTPTWQERNPGVCAGCDEPISGPYYDPTGAPIHAICRDLLVGHHASRREHNRMREVRYE